MRKINIGIIEDEGAARRRLARFVENQENLNLVLEADSGKSAIEKISKEQPDLLILDIELKDMTAFDVIKELPNDYSGRIIFLTAFDHYAVKAFDVFALDYILKPFQPERLLNAIKRSNVNTQQDDVQKVKNQLDYFQNQGSKVLIPEGNTQHFIETERILWIEADNYHSMIHLTGDEQMLIRITLKEIARYLPADFLRINRSQIIHLKHVVRKRSSKNEVHFTLDNNRDFIGNRNYLEIG
jgi:two-component system LytT family response regulator